MANLNRFSINQTLLLLESQVTAVDDLSHRIELLPSLDLSVYRQLQLNGLVDR